VQVVGPESARAPLRVRGRRVTRHPWRPLVNHGLHLAERLGLQSGGSEAQRLDAEETALQIEAAVID